MRLNPLILSRYNEQYIFCKGCFMVIYFFNILKSIRVILSLALFIIFLIPSKALCGIGDEIPHSLSISRFSISGGVAFNWTLHNKNLKGSSQPDWLYEGNIGKYLSLGYKYSIDNTGYMFFVMTLEKFKSNFQYWDRTTVGTLNATCIRIDPFIIHTTGKGLNFSLNLAGLIVMVGDITVLDGYRLYYPDGDVLRRVEEIKQKPSFGVTLAGLGVTYTIPKTKIQISLESSIAEMIKSKVLFKTSSKTFEEKAAQLFGLVPVRIRISLTR